MKKLHLKLIIATLIIVLFNICYYSFSKYRQENDLHKSLMQDFNTYNPYLEEQTKINIDKKNNVSNNVQNIILEQKDILDNVSSSGNIQTNIQENQKTSTISLNTEIIKTENEEKITDSTPIIQENILSIYDTDNSILKFVSNKVSLNNLKYKPNDLEKISGDYLIDKKGGQILRKEALKNLQDLSIAFYNEFQVKIPIVSAFRSYEYQKGIIDRGCSPKFCAKPGFSEHQLGLAVDMFEASSQKEFLSKPDLEKYFLWLMENAHIYGFHNSYQNGVEIDGYNIEPWHWRYLGIDLATTLHENNETFSIYYKNIK